MLTPRELRYTFRLFRRTPGVTLAAVITLALGIAASTLVFSIVDTVLLRPLPYADPNRLLVLSERSSRSDLMSVSYPDYLDWRHQQTVFTGLAARNYETFNLTGMGEPEQVAGSNVSAELFEVLGVTPALGRVFAAAEDRPGSHVVVLTYASWRKRFNGDSRIIGRAVTLDDEAYTIVGVLPQRFRYPIGDERGEIFAPLGRQADDLRNRGSHPGIAVIARLKTGMSINAARAQLDTIAERLAAQYPDTNRDIRVRVERYQDRVVSATRPMLLALWAAVGGVLLVSCANAAALLLARGAARTREFAVRLAIGAGREDVLGQLLTEGGTIAILAGVLGVGLATALIPAVKLLLPSSIPRVSEIGVDGRVLAATTLAAAVFALVCGLLPALQALRTPIYAASRTSAGVLSERTRLRSGLVVLQLACSQALLVAASLLIASFAHLVNRSPGFDTDRAMVAQFYLPDATYRTYEQIVGFHDELIRRVGELPSVSAAGLIAPLPFGMGDNSDDYVIEGRPALNPTDVDVIKADVFRASPTALTALGIRLVAGRFFDDHDRRGSAAVVVIDDRFADTYFAGQNPLGRRLRSPLGSQWMEIVGVVRHVNTHALDERGRVQVYHPLLATSAHFASVVVRTTTASPLTLISSVRHAAQKIDPNLPLFNASSMRDLVAESTVGARLSAWLFGAFAVIGGTLAAIGLSALVAYLVTLRTREIGIRLALGAQPKSLVRLAAARGVALVATGAVLGLLAGIAVARALTTLLVGIGPSAPGPFLAAACVLVVTGLLASYVPARRASRVDPLIALRTE